MNKLQDIEAHLVKSSDVATDDAEQEVVEARPQQATVIVHLGYALVGFRSIGFAHLGYAPPPDPRRR